MAWSSLAWEEKTEGWVNPAEGIITSSFGMRSNPVLRTQEHHDGIDIALATGTAVQAVRSGVVVKVRTSLTYGKVVEYETEDGYRIMYAHLSEILVEKGDEIRQGDVVARSGNTGLSTGPHLHYGVSKDDVWIDPMEYVQLAYSEDVVKEYEARGEKIFVQNS